MTTSSANSRLPASGTNQQQTISDLMAAMRAAGAPIEAIEIAVRAIEFERASLAAEKAKDEERREKRARQKREERAKSRDNTATVARHGSDIDATVAATPPSPSPPRDIINPPNPSPSPTSLRSVGGAKRSKARSAIAEDAQPGEPERMASETAGLSNAEFRDEWRKFRDHHRAKGSLMADWAAAWRTWLGNRNQFRPARAGPAPSNRNGFAALAVKLYGNNDGKRTQNGSLDNPVLLLPVNAHGERGTGGADDASLPRKAGDGFG